MSERRRAKPGGMLRIIGLGLITGAADDDPSAVGTYASAGAKLGPAFLWTAPVLLPMMVAVVYLAAKLGQVAGEGLFAVLKRRYSAWLLYPTLVGALISNTIEARMRSEAVTVPSLAPAPRRARHLAAARAACPSDAFAGTIAGRPRPPPYHRGPWTSVSAGGSATPAPAGC